MTTETASAQTWSGATSGNWNTGGNWVGGVAPTTGTAITFTGSGNPVTNNDISTLTTGNISFDASTGANFTLGGNSIVLGGNLTTSATAAAVFNHLINFNIQLNGNRQFNAANSNNLTLNGAITEDATPRNVTRGTGGGSITWNGANTFSGTLTLAGNGANIFNTIADTGSSSIGIGTADIFISGASASHNAFQFNGTAAGATNRNIVLSNNTPVGIVRIANNSTAATSTLTLGGTVTSTTTALRTLTLTGSNTGENLLSGVISQGAGAGVVSFAKSGAGTWNLSGANTFTGGVEIQQGILSVANIGSVGSASSNLGAQATAALATINIGSGTLGATLRYTGAGETTDRVINFAGGAQTATINHSGTGVLRFTSNTTATIDGAKTLSLNGAGTAGGKRGEFAGIISNSATGITTVTKADSGRWALQGTNTFTGAVNLNNGFLEVATIGNQGVASNLGAGTTLGFGQGTANGTLEYIGAGETTNRIVDLKTSNVGGGRIANNGTGALIFTSDMVNSGTVSAKTLFLAGTSTGFVNQFNGVINNQAGGLAVGLTKEDVSTWSLGGTNIYSGATTVSAGTLIINGDQTAATGAVTVATGATLAGSGIIGGATTIDGTHNPGNSPGIQTFLSSLTYNTGAIVNWELNGNSVSNSPLIFDQVNAGALNFSGSTTLNIDLQAGVNLSDSFWLTDKLGTAGWLAFNGTSVAGFSNLSIGSGLTNSAGTFSLFEDSANGDVYLNFTAVPEPSSFLVGIMVVGIAISRRRRS